MKSFRIFLVALLWLFTFTTAYANVRINEVAWMGTSVSGTNEWIELSNEGDVSVDLSGWSIVALDGSPSIMLSGSVAPRGFFLIERTDDTTVPDVAADQVAPFGSGLSNAGETLYLKDSSGSIVDTVVGGTDWENIGGDNATKETPQRTTSAWVIGIPTPRTANISHGEVLGVAATPAGISTNVPSVSVSTGSSVITSTTPTYPRSEISVFAGDDKNILTHSRVHLTGTAYGLYDELLPYATYRWNFGDGATALGKDVSHAYRFPGEYTVTLEVFWGDKQRSDRMKIVVVTPGITIGETVSGQDGSIQLLNRSEREIDLSLWRVRTATGAMFILPQNTFVEAGRVIRLPNAITGLTEFTSGLELMDQDENIIATTPTVPPSRPSIVPFSNLKQSTTKAVLSAGIAKSSIEESGPLVGDNSASAVLWQGGAEKNGATRFGIDEMTSNNMKWIFLMLFIALIIFAGFLVSRSGEENSIASEYAIIEDIIESKESLDK